MKNFLVFYAILLSFSAIANDCEKEIEQYGDGKHNKGFSKECVEEFKSHSPANLRGHKTLEGFEVFISEGIVIFEKDFGDHFKRDFIAGKMSELGKIKTFALNNKHLEILIVDDENRIKIYSSYVTGNVSPSRVIETVPGEIVNLAFVEETSEIAVLTKEYLYFFDNKANTLGFKKKDKFKKRVDVNQKISKMLYDQKLKSLVFLDEKNLKVFTLNSTDQNLVEKTANALDIQYENNEVKVVLKEIKPVPVSPENPVAPTE